jgi:hypothetical protein
MDMHVITEEHPLSRKKLTEIAAEQYGDLVKAVVDIEKGAMALGGEMHADEEAALLEQGSEQKNLWGINLYPEKSEEEWVEFDSMINVRPSQGNRSRDVEDPALRERIKAIIATLII